MYGFRRLCHDIVGDIMTNQQMFEFFSKEYDRYENIVLSHEEACDICIKQSMCAFSMRLYEIFEIIELKYYELGEITGNTVKEF